MDGSSLPFKSYIYHFVFPNNFEKASNQQEIWKVTTLVEEEVASEISQNKIDFKHFLHFEAKRLR